MNRWLHFVAASVLLCAACEPLVAGEPQADTITVHGAWARATAPGMTVGAMYLTLQGGAAADRLVAATTPRAAMTQIHEVTTVDGMMRMREITGVDVPARAVVVLAPQGTHLMLMGLTQPLVAGERIPLTLQFAQAGKRTINVDVRPPGDSPATPH